MDRFKALLVSKGDDGQSVEWTELGDDDLMEGDVTVRVTHSTLNYKDGLAITGAAPIVRQYPMIPGIDLAGEVISSSSSDYSAGDKVLVNGWGLGETHFGGYSERARREGRLACAGSRRFQLRRYHGYRDGRIYSNAVRPGA